MPEIFEVRRIASYLSDSGILNSPIIGLESSSFGEKLLKQFSLEEWKNILYGQSIQAINTKAKYTLFSMTEGMMVWHYRLTGLPYVEDFEYGDRLVTLYSLPLDNPSRYKRFSIIFQNGKRLHFSDMRLFSTIDFYRENISLNVADDLYHCYLSNSRPCYNSLEKSRKDLKTFLQDQKSYPSGIGNYLACEILAHAKLNPWQKLFSLSEEHWNNLFDAIHTVVEHCLNGASYEWFRVFKQQQCKECNGTVYRKKHKGKSSQMTHFCPNCQSV